MVANRVTFWCSDCKRLIVRPDTWPGSNDAHRYMRGERSVQCYGIFEQVERPEVVAAWHLGGDAAVDELAQAEGYADPPRHAG